MNNTNDTAERSVASDGSVAWPSVGMISENRLRELMAYVGLLNSKSLLAALRQCDMEARLDVAARLRLTDAEREAIRTAADAYAVRGSADGRESVNAATLRGLLERLR